MAPTLRTRLWISSFATALLLQRAGACGLPDAGLAVQLIDLDEATEIIADLTNQACSTDGGLDSMAISAYAEAIDYLAKRGMVKIDRRAGRRVTARWVER